MSQLPGLGSHTRAPEQTGDHLAITWPRLANTAANIPTLRHGGQWCRWRGGQHELIMCEAPPPRSPHLTSTTSSRRGLQGVETPSTRHTTYRVYFQAGRWMDAFIPTFYIFPLILNSPSSRNIAFGHIIVICLFSNLDIHSADKRLSLSGTYANLPFNLPPNLRPSLQPGEMSVSDSGAVE